MVAVESVAVPFMVAMASVTVPFVMAFVRAPLMVEAALMVVATSVTLPFVTGTRTVVSLPFVGAPASVAAGLCVVSAVENCGSATAANTNSSRGSNMAIKVVNNVSHR